MCFQEQLWQHALDEIQKDIGSKLDKMELAPLRDFVNNKLKSLQDKLRTLAALKKDTEAAGTKKLLRDVNCLSCDKDVVMRRDLSTSMIPPPPSLPPGKSMGPYLAYELDALRKQQKWYPFFFVTVVFYKSTEMCLCYSFPHSRNLNHFETAMNVAKTKG